MILASVSSTDNIGGYILIALQTLALGFFVIAGIAQLRQKQILESPRAILFQGQQWQKRLKKWNIVLEERKSSEVLHEIEQSWQCVQPILSQLAIMALLDVSWMINTIFLQLQLNGMSEQLSLTLTYTLLAIIYVGMLLIRGGSYILGLQRLRQRAMRHISYGDVQPRKLTNYRPAFFRLIPATLVICTIIATTCSLPYLPTQLNIRFLSLTSLNRTGEIWVIGVLLLALIAICLTAEILAERVATFSRQFVTTNPAVSRQIDDVFRARIISTLFGDECIALTFLCVAQWWLWLSPLEHTVPGYVALLSQFCLVVAAISFVAGLFGYLCDGHLGGTVARWHWKRGSAK